MTALKIPLKKNFQIDSSWLLGFVMASPFVEAIFPVRFWVPLIAMLYFVKIVFIKKIDWNAFQNRLRTSCWLLLLAGINVLALFATPHYFFSNAYPLIVFFSLYLAWLCSPIELIAEKLWQGFLSALLPSAFLAAVIGLFKIWMVERGYMLMPLNYIYELADVSYPGGSSLKPDYNLPTQALTVAIFFLLTREYLLNWQRILKITGIFLISAAIYYTSSRRGVLYLAAMPFIYMAYCTYLKRISSRAVFIVLISFSSLGILLYVSSAFVMYGQFYSSYKQWPFSDSRPAKPYEYIVSLVPFSPPAGINTAIDHNHEFKYPRPFNSNERPIRWSYAWELLREKYFVLPYGYSYQKLFSCKFTDCQLKDYPHNVFLSEWLAEGILGLVLLILALGSYFKSIFLTKNLESRSKLFALSFLVVPSMLISGDYLLSMSMICSSIILSLIISMQKT